MEPTLKRAWSEIIQAEDYELHMANIGQAQANAELVRDLLEETSLITGDRILFAGAGPGQMFDYVASDFLLAYEVTFSDINPRFLERLKSRAQRAGMTRFTTEVDDIEATQLKGPFAAAVLVLVLEHVDWRKTLAALANLRCGWLVLIVQRNPENMESMVAPNRELPGSLKAASGGEKSRLIDRAELEEHLASLGYVQAHSKFCEVPDGKTMCGLVVRLA